MAQFTLHGTSYPENISGGIRFGAMLRQLRERSSAKKLETNAVGDATSSMAKSAKDVCDFLATRGCPLSVRGYREIEAGVRLPQNCPVFLDAFVECFSLSDEKSELLTLLLAREILAEALNPSLADEILGPCIETQDIARL